MSNSAITIQELLRDELTQRRAKNPRYSLRTFAQALGISPSFLSKVLTGKKSLSEENFFKIASRLELSDEKIENLRSSLPSFKAGALAYSKIDADKFQSIADWHYYAIMEAFTLEGFEPTAQWISAKINITEDRAKEAIERLSRLGYLKKDDNGNWSWDENNYSAVSSTGSTEALREHERQILQQGMAAMNDIPVELRTQSSVTMAIPSSRVKEAKKKIAEFRHELADLMQRPGKRDEIYQLSISFFPVTYSKAKK